MDADSKTTRRATDTALENAAEALLRAYRDRYTTPSTRRLRANAPLRSEMGELKIALRAAKDVTNG